jgi:demethylmenaquinone methyltransferase/2-methoxy-6-polyprenyl-1,4-benzoquinol methylase
VILTDVNPAMLEVAQKRALDRGIVRGVEFAVVDAERIPLPDRSVEKVSIAFGLRNCTDKDAVLREARRVLRPGGRFHCLEFSKVELAPLAPIYDAWSSACCPRSARAWPRTGRATNTSPRASAASGPGDAGGHDARGGAGARGDRNLSGGIVAIHTGWRL